MKYAVLTFGCRVNQADSLSFEEEFHARGFRSSAAEDADIVVVNTCSVTSSADQGARQTIRRIARTNPSARIIVTGCYATRRPDEVATLPNVVRLVTNPEKADLAQVVDNMRETTAERFGDGDGSCGATIEPGAGGRTAFTLRVQTGCAEECAYCIIPVTRGRPQSVPLPALAREIQRISDAGYKEIALTGVHLGSYGRDLSPATSLLELLASIDSRHCREVRFRVSSLEPRDCSDEIVDLLAASDAFAPHFHLPLQHASDRMLGSMRRPYSLAYYDRLVVRVREKMPDASIGTDIIVGYPGETDEDFEQLVRYLPSSPITHVHVFPYSDRPGTAASAMRDKVPGVIVRERAQIVRDLSKRLTMAFRAGQAGSQHRALTIDDGTMAVTGNYLKVRIPPGRTRNEWLQVRVSEAGDPMIGVVV